MSGQTPDDFAEIDAYIADPFAFRAGVPHAMFKRLRDEDPVHWTPGKFSQGFWSVTRRADIETILLDAEGFSSELRGNHLPESAIVSQLMETAPQVLGCGAILPRLDAPKHRDLRMVFDRSISARIVAGFEPMVRAIVVEVIEAAKARGRCDFVQDIALPIPLRSICEIMGVPAEDRQKLMRWTEQALFAAEADFVPDPGSGDAGGFEQLSQYGLQLAHARRREPRDDVTTVLAEARVDGEYLPDDLLMWNVAGFIMGGLETTRNAISGGVAELLRDVEQTRRLVADPQLMATAVEELLRFSSPITHLLRVATRDAELHGHRIRKGDWVVCWLASANRDEAAFECPHQMDVARKPNRHSAFGLGPHFCIGRSLAMMEIRITLEEMLKRMPTLVADGPVSRLTSLIGAGLKQMPVKV